LLRLPLTRLFRHCYHKEVPRACRSDEFVTLPISSSAQANRFLEQWLEMEIGITGGEEDGVNNEDGKHPCSSCTLKMY
jgi:hypothetical protein